MESAHQGGEAPRCLGQGRGAALLMVIAHAVPNTTAVALCIRTMGELYHSLITPAYPRPPHQTARHHGELMADSKQSLLYPEGTCFSH